MEIHAGNGPNLKAIFPSQSEEGWCMVRVHPQAKTCRFERHGGRPVSKADHCSRESPQNGPANGLSTLEWVL